ncbi:19332_t:CDS:2, partial [Cetraspora pellucida]
DSAQDLLPIVIPCFVGLVIIIVFVLGLIKSHKKGMVPHYLLYFTLAFALPPLCVNLIQEELDDLRKNSKINEPKKDDPFCCGIWDWFKDCLKTCFTSMLSCCTVLLSIITCNYCCLGPTAKPAVRVSIMCTMALYIPGVLHALIMLFKMVDMVKPIDETKQEG